MAQLSCMPSTLHTNVAVWSDMQPLSTHTSPDGHVPSTLRGTHVPSTQTSTAVPQSLVIVHGLSGTVHRPIMVSQP